MVTEEDVRRLRLAAHGLAPRLGLDPVGVVDRAVALQGQDLPAVLRAIALRAGTDVAEVRSAFDAGDLVRSWPMRGTLFASTPAWLASLLALTAERTEKSMVRRREALGIDDAVIARSEAVARERLADGPVSRAAILAAWEEAGLEVARGPGYHLIVLHSVRGLWHWGPFVGDDQCLVATPPQVPIDHLDQALADVAAGYVRGRGPVSVDDLAWWTKLPKGQVRRALARCEDIAEVELEGAPYLVEQGLLDDLPDLPPLGGEVQLLPAFDEYVLGYQRRDLIASPAMQQAVVPGNNGVFRPVIVVSGRVVGTWKRGKQGGEVTELVEKVTTAERRAIDEALAALAGSM